MIRRPFVLFVIFGGKNIYFCWVRGRRLGAQGKVIALSPSSLDPPMNYSDTNSLYNMTQVYLRDCQISL